MPTATLAFRASSTDSSAEDEALAEALVAMSNHNENRTSSQSDDEGNTVMGTASDSTVGAHANANNTVDFTGDENTTAAASNQEASTSRPKKQAASKKKKRKRTNNNRKHSVQLFAFDVATSTAGGGGSGGNVDGGAGAGSSADGGDSGENDATNDNDANTAAIIRSSRPRRTLKTIRRYSPNRYSSTAAVKTGHGFACPMCSAACSYLERSCSECGCGCAYEAGVGVVLLKERRIVNDSVGRTGNVGRNGGNGGNGRTARRKRRGSRIEFWVLPS